VGPEKLAKQEIKSCGVGGGGGGGGGKGRGGCGGRGGGRGCAACGGGGGDSRRWRARCAWSRGALHYLVPVSCSICFTSKRVSLRRLSVRPEAGSGSSTAADSASLVVNRRQHKRDKQQQGYQKSDTLEGSVVTECWCVVIRGSALRLLHI
jgi:hypothetical protein